MYRDPTDDQANARAASQLRPRNDPGRGLEMEPDRSAPRQSSAGGAHPPGQHADGVDGPRPHRVHDPGVVARPEPEVVGGDDQLAVHDVGGSLREAPAGYAPPTSARSPLSRSPISGKIAVERMAAPTREAAVVARMSPLSIAIVVIATTSGSSVALKNASALRSRASRTLR